LNGSERKLLEKPARWNRMGF